MNETTFKKEIENALLVFDKYVICLNKTPDEFLITILSLVNKAIAAYKGREEGKRHGIALDKWVTVILSQQDNKEIPLCSIYFNLHSPYSTSEPKKVKPEPAT